MAKSTAELELVQNDGSDTETNMGAATDNEDDESSAKNDREALEALPDGSRTQVMVTMPKELKLLLLSKADEKGYTLARYLREWIATELDFTLPDTIRTRAPKYATEAEKIAAQKSKAKARNDLIKKLLGAYKAGDIDLDALDDDEDDDDE